MIFKKTTLVAVMLLLSAGCNAEQQETAAIDTNLESFQVAVADGGPYAAPLPAGAKAKAEKPKRKGVSIYIPGQENADSVEKVVEEGMISDVGMSPRERVASTPKGKLKNPYTDDEEMELEGHKRFMGNSCNGCHGGTGGGGMCPPLSNEVFVYGSDDDTLFRLITLGSDDLAKLGYYRKGMEGVVGPMPPYGDIIKTDEELWKIIAWIRTVFNGDEKRRNW
ncbi:MAG: c-type cytochrome [Methylophaga sp.]|nr:c-type cytochrome [Methylophaga sp.]